MLTEDKAFVKTIYVKSVCGSVINVRHQQTIKSNLSPEFDCKRFEKFRILNVSHGIGGDNKSHGESYLVVQMKRNFGTMNSHVYSVFLPEVSITPILFSAHESQVFQLSYIILVLLYFGFD